MVVTMSHPVGGVVTHQGCVMKSGLVICWLLQTSERLSVWVLRCHTKEVVSLAYGLFDRGDIREQVACRHLLPMIIPRGLQLNPVLFDVLLDDSKFLLEVVDGLLVLQFQSMVDSRALLLGTCLALRTDNKLL